MVTVLNVAEKPSIAKTIAQILSNGQRQHRPGCSKYNPCYQFKCSFSVANAYPAEREFDMVMTSVSGHLMGMDFAGKQYTDWNAVPPSALFHAPVEFQVLSNAKDIERTLKREIRNAQMLVIWTDCDREGEAIGQEIVDVCRQVNQAFVVKRAQFSAANAANIWTAIRNLRDMNMREVNAARARSEIDFRIGCAFTREQTLELKQRFPELDGQIMSFGPCQFPTLGFVVNRAEEIRHFQSELFWTIQMSWSSPDQREMLSFTWDRQRLFDHQTATMLFENCQQDREAVVTRVERKPKSKWRPVPLSTVEMQMRLSRYRRMNSELAMKTAERLYQKGIISYPRTETDVFENSFDLRGLVGNLAGGDFGNYVQLMLGEDGFQHPRAGRNNDEAHPPIHPLQSVPLQTLDANERTVYEFVVRHFLACCSRDAQGSETTIQAEIGGETFTAKGIEVLARNYLDIYVYESWAERQLPTLESGNTFEPNQLDLVEGRTQPPQLLTEAELIRLMDKHGVGTDATIQDHIKTILQRSYAMVVKAQSRERFKPTALGTALILAYKGIGHERVVSQPDTRAGMERDFKRIAQGQKTKDQVVQEIIQTYRDVYDNKVVRNNLYNQTFEQYYYRGEGDDENIDNNYDGGDDDDDDDDNNGNNNNDNNYNNGARRRGPDKATRNAATLEAYRCAKRAFSKCGKCGDNIALYSKSIEKNGPRGGRQTYSIILFYCKKCEEILTMPNRKDLNKPTPCEHTCVLCQSQVIKYKRDNGSDYYCCPVCYSNPPNAGDMEDMDQRGRAMSCQQCTEKSCALATGVVKSGPIVKCKSCNGTRDMVLAKSSNNTRLSCTGYPLCKGLIRFKVKPKNVEVANEVCGTCGSRKLKLEYSSGALPPGHLSRQVLCPRPKCYENDIDLRDLFEYSSGWVSHSNDSNARRESNSPIPVTASPGSKRVLTVEPDFQTNKRARPEPTSDPETKLCKTHGEPCVIRIVKKDGPNQGRQAYFCARSSNDAACGFNGFTDEQTSNIDSFQNNNAFQANNAPCYKCNQPGHFASACQNNNSNQGRAGMTCFKCNQPGHFANECPSSNNYQPDRGISSSNAMVCFKCNQPGHFANACPNNDSNGYQPDRGRSFPPGGMVCFKCNQPGHFANSCLNSNDDTGKYGGTQNFQKRKGKKGSGKAASSKSQRLCEVCNTPFEKRKRKCRICGNTNGASKS